MGLEKPLTVEAVCRCGARVSMGAAAAGKSVPCFACGEKVQLPGRAGAPAEPEKPKVSDELQARYRAAIDALKEHPRDPELILAAARVAEEMNNRSEAFLYFERAYNLDPSRGDLIPALRQNAATPEQTKKVETWSGRPAGFMASIPDAFAYPLRGSGPIMLIMGALMLFGIRFMLKFNAFPLIALLVFVILYAYLTKFYILMLNTSAIGEEDIPQWPDYTDIPSLIQDLARFTGAYIISFLPMLILGAVLFAGFWNSVDLKDPGGGASESTCLMMLAALAGMGVFGLVGCAYLPMAITANAVFGFALGCANPAFIGRSIWLTRSDYAVCALTFFVVSVTSTVLEGLSGLSVTSFLLASIPATCIEIYGIAVQMRLLGMFFRYNQGRLGWLT